MKNYSTFVGLDAHKKEISVAVLFSDETESLEWSIKNEPRAIRRMVRKVSRVSSGDVLYCYEAGPLGYTLARRISSEGSDCQVVAPSLIPKKPGNRVKTDRRDARELGGLLRAGLLTEVEPPTEEEESIRNLCRCRESVKRDLRRCRNRLSHFLLRQGYVYPHGTKWTERYYQWIKSLKFDHDADRITFEQYLFSAEQLQEQLRSLDHNLEQFSEREPYRETVARLRCFRGIDTVTAMTIASELYNCGRFSKPRELMSFLGLTPSEYSSADSRRLGSITKCGNAHVRRVLIEASWHYQYRPSVGIRLSKRRQGQPTEIISLADKAQKRLHGKYIRLVMKGKPKNKAVTSVARELTGFIWSVLNYQPSCES